MTTPDADEAVQRELLGIVQGDPARARSLRRSLDRMASGAGGEELREMARDVLAGRMSLRKAALSGVYGDHLRRHLVRAVEQYRELSPQQQEEVRRARREELRQLGEDA